jgi:hypothetical protein
LRAQVDAAWFLKGNRESESAGNGRVAWRLGGVRGEMSEVVVQLSVDESSDSTRLTEALDAFAKWSAESGLLGESGDAPDLMMMTEHTGDGVRRKLVFQNREHAARFLVFWRTERHRVRAEEATVVAVTA